MTRRRRTFTAVLEREDDGYVALRPELDVVSQGDTIEAARANLTEAVELFLESASEQEISERLSLARQEDTQCPNPKTPELPWPVR